MCSVYLSFKSVASVFIRPSIEVGNLVVKSAYPKLIVEMRLHHSFCWPFSKVMR